MSNMERTDFQSVKFTPGIARGKNGEPLASLEMVTVINLVSVDAPDGTNVTLRGITSQGQELRQGLHIVKGFVEAQGGRVRAENRADRGAKFTILLRAQSSTPLLQQVA